MFSSPSFSGLVELNNGFSPRPQISHVIFDFDGTLSWLRHGWPEIMVQLFRDYVPLRDGESESVLHESLLQDVLSLNGKSSIYQMIRCVERARERGIKSPSPENLLQEYQRRLDTAIIERAEKISCEAVAPDHFVVHQARPLLEKLKQRGLTLIVLSGTVENRVKEEAVLLGLADYFGKHIYGSTANTATSSKAAVMNRLLREENFSGDQLLSFGDGPVEMELTKQLGGIAIGVASDENENGSGKIHAQKRHQLVTAGADVIIPDYRDASVLMDQLLEIK